MIGIEQDRIIVEETDNVIDVEHGNDFITKFTDVFPVGYCEHMVKEFERLANNGAGTFRPKKKHAVDDYNFMLMPGIHNLELFNGVNPIDGFFKRLQICYDSYAKKYSFLQDIQVHCTNMKMQRTHPGGGYHIFHSEAGPQNEFVHYQSRAIVYTCYLNTLDSQTEGGETEFLYQKKRIPATENTVLFWPATYTHVHRGNVVLGSKSKYIITGWFYYGAAE